MINEVGAAPRGSDPIYRRIVWRIMPIILFAYFLCYLDRVNIGFGKLQFLGDLHLNDAHFGLATGLFFVTYCLFDIPSNLMLNRIGVRRTLLRIMVAWGCLTIAQMFIRTATQLYVLRLLFGAAEAGFIPGIMLYLTYWFPNAYRARIVSLFLLGIPLSGIIGGPLSGFIMHAFNDVGGLRGWQWLFLLEGIPAIVTGIAAFFYLDNRPSEARWLSQRDKDVLTADFVADRSATVTLDGGSWLAVFRDPFLYLLAALNFAVNAAVNAVSFWTPSLLRTVGVENVATIGLLAGLISAAGGAGMILIARNSDLTMERRMHLVLSGLVFSAGFLALPLFSGDVVLTVCGLMVSAVGGYCALMIFWTVPTSYFHGRSAPGAIGAVSAVGAVGSGVSPTIIGWLRVDTGSLYTGMAVIAAIMVVGCMAALLWLPRDHRVAQTSPRTA
jgi:ACS family phthalate transporter-like MFS transporter